MLSRTQMFQQENRNSAEKGRTALSECCRKELGTTLCFYRMTLWGPIHTVVIECTKVLTKAQRPSKFSISSHMLRDHHLQQIPSTKYLHPIDVSPSLH